MTTSYHIDIDAENKAIVRAYRKLLRSINPPPKAKKKQQIRRAYQMALKAHAQQRRKSGEPYIYHPIAVAQIVSEEIGLTDTSVICALLHDVVEDTDITLEQIETSFGKEVARIIDGLTKITHVFGIKNSLQAENFKKILRTLTEDVRAVLIKIADRLHNMRTMQAMPKHKQVKIASETLFLYAPIAHRMGLYNIKSELEDLSMKYTESEMYRQISKKLNATKRQRTRDINHMIRPLKASLDELGYAYDIKGRPKSIYSIWNKMKTKNVAFQEVYDLYAIRIVMDVPIEQEKIACWSAYAIITNEYKPNPDRLRDWISNPKTNGYESLHTTVMGPKGKWVEIQVRSKRMDQIAEQGIAAHWKYKDHKEHDILDDWLEKIQTVLKSNQDDAVDFVNDFKSDLFSREIQVFTPKGDSKRLPKDASVLDFAFEIHTQIGLKAKAAKVNQFLVPLSHTLQNGDQVDIIVGKQSTVSSDWLSFVKSGRSKVRIKKALRLKQKKIGIAGEKKLRDFLNQNHIDSHDKNIQSIVTFYQYATPLDLYVGIAEKSIDLEKILNLKIIAGQIKYAPYRNNNKHTQPVEDIVKEKLQKNAEWMIMQESNDNLDYDFAECCTPIPGDEVFGFITLDQGIDIHRSTCYKAVDMMSKYSYRVIKTKWTKQHQISFLTGIQINGIDDTGVINHIMDVIYGQLHINIRSMNYKSSHGVFESQIMLYVADLNELNFLIDQLKNIDFILSVCRIKTHEQKNKSI